jgi:hypothetical protein
MSFETRWGRRVVSAGWRNVASGRSARALLVLAASIAISNAAQAVDASCGKNDFMAASIGVARSANATVRTSTLKTVAESWQFSLPELMREIERMKRVRPGSAWDKPDLEWSTAITGTVKTILASYDQAIPLFRKCDDEGVIKPLVWAARGDERDLRLNSANILANIVDNTTVCFVVHHLSKTQPQLGDDGRANLLGITRAMAGYVYQDTAQDIEKVVRQLQTSLGDRLKQLTQTATLLVNISSRAAKSENRTTPLPEALQRYCKGYNYEAELD